MAAFNYLVKPDAVNGIFSYVKQNNIILLIILNNNKREGVYSKK